jgi:rhodanese-related sulfurtransferase
MKTVNPKIVSPAALSALLNSGNHCELLDVRTPPEYASAHVPGAKLIPLADLKVEDFLSRHAPGKPIYVLCQSGARASKAIEQMKSVGCDDGVLVDGGTQAWIDAGFPVHRGARNVLPLMRQVQIVIGTLSIASSILALTVNLWFAIVPLLLGCGLLFAGITGTCGLALLLARMPWNRGQANCKHCCIPE